MKKGNVLFTALFMGLVTLSSAGQASCHNDGAERAVRYSSPVSGTLTIARDQPLGSTIGGLISIADSPDYVKPVCTGKQYQLIKFGSTMTASSYPGIYETNVPGIGFKVSKNNSDTVIAGNAVSIYAGPLNANTYYRGSFTNMKIRFYLIGPVSADAGPVKLNFSVQGGTSESTTSLGVLWGQVSVTGTFPIAYSSCTTPDITVDLKKHSKSDFPALGATSAATPFNFEINNCGKGLNAVSYTFTPASGINLVNAGSSNQYLTLKSNSRASGVGVQLLYANDTIVPFNSKTTFTGYSPTTGGDYTIPMKARYIRTGDITPGSAHSAVEFVMAYE